MALKIHEYSLHTKTKGFLLDRLFQANPFLKSDFAIGSVSASELSKIMADQSGRLVSSYKYRRAKRPGGFPASGFV